MTSLLYSCLTELYVLGSMNLIPTFLSQSPWPTALCDAYNNTVCPTMLQNEVSFSNFKEFNTRMIFYTQSIENSKY